MQFGRYNDEADSYRGPREELLQAEIALRDQREKVADLRRKLSQDTPTEDYELKEGPSDLDADGPITSVRLSELFDLPDRSLVLYHFMYGAAQSNPCPMCGLVGDSLNGIGRHLRQVVNFAMVAQAEPDAWRAVARERGWRDLRLLSSAGSSFKADFALEDSEGGQHPGVTVFTKGGSGGLRLAFSGSAIMGEGEFRGLDLLMPLWHVLDLTPEGRGEFWPKLSYD